MVIVEGPDGAGKSTLASHLYEDRVIRTVVDSPSRTRKEVPLYEQTRRYLEMYKNKHNICIDRFLFSEMIYGPLLRNSCKITKFQYVTILQEIISSGSIIIFCLPPVGDLKLKPGENKAVRDNIAEIHSQYIDTYITTASMYSKAISYNFKKPDEYFEIVKKLRGEVPWNAQT